MPAAKPKPDATGQRPRRASVSRTASAHKPATFDKKIGEGAFDLVDRVYESIREAIREGGLAPGQRLVERDLALWLNVSRTPVREALRLLEAHGLASAHGGRGLLVTALGPDEVAELYFAWENLEALAAQTAAQYATSLEIDALHEIAALWDENATPRMLGRLNKRFHFAIHLATHNRFLVRALRTIDDSVSLLGLTTYTIPGRAREVAAEHAAILNAIAARDQTAAEAAARRHIHRAGQLRMALTRDLESPKALASAALRGAHQRRRS